MAVAVVCSRVSYFPSFVCLGTLFCRPPLGYVGNISSPRQVWIYPESGVVCTSIAFCRVWSSPNEHGLCRISVPLSRFLRRYFEADGSTRPVSISTAHILTRVVFFFLIQSIGLKHSFALELTGSGPLRSQTFLRLVLLLIFHKVVFGLRS